MAQNTVGAGTDTLATIEHLTGSAFGDTLTGSTGANRIEGGAGNDTLAGGVGADNFVFNSALGASNVDSNLDFSVVDDTIQLENTGIFAALTTTGVLAAGAFQTGGAALDADDRILYDSSTGRLLYDVDGSGGQAAVQFAVLSTGLSLTNVDFLVI